MFGQKLKWEDISTAPRDGTPILAECADEETRYIATVAYWTVDMLKAATSQDASWKLEDEYWSLSHGDFCCEPVRWLRGFEVPDAVTVQP